MGSLLENPFVGRAPVGGRDVGEGTGLGTRRVPVRPSSHRPPSLRLDRNPKRPRHSHVLPPVSVSSSPPVHPVLGPPLAIQIIVVCSGFVAGVPNGCYRNKSGLHVRVSCTPKAPLSRKDLWTVPNFGPLGLCVDSHPQPLRDLTDTSRPTPPSVKDRTPDSEDPRRVQSRPDRRRSRPDLLPGVLATTRSPGAPKGRHRKPTRPDLLYLFDPPPRDVGRENER